MYRRSYGGRECCITVLTVTESNGPCPETANCEGVGKSDRVKQRQSTDLEVGKQLPWAKKVCRVALRCLPRRDGAVEGKDWQSQGQRPRKHLLRRVG